MSKYKQKIGWELLKLVIVAAASILVRKIKNYFIKISIATIFLIFGTYYIIDGLIRIIAEHFGINLEHLRILTGVALLLGSYIILRSVK